MAKIKKLTLDGTTIYPATIMEAVKNRTTDKTLAAELLTLVKAVSSGATTPDAALSALTALGSGYNSVVAVATTLKDFLTNATDSDTVINKWKEIEAFLSGITETQNLTGLLKNSETNVKNWANEKFVDLDTEQIISARKAFSGGILFENGGYIFNTGTELKSISSKYEEKSGLSLQDGYATISADEEVRIVYGDEDAYIVFPKKDGTVALVEDIPGVVTQSANGLMSAADKKKLDAFGAATTYLTAAACNDVTDYPEITI